MSTAMSHPNTRTIELEHKQLLILDAMPGTRMQVLDGGIWLTEENSFEDRFASSGQWLMLEARGRTIAESRGRSRLRVVEPTCPGSGRWRSLADQFLSFGRAPAALLALLIGIGLPVLLVHAMQRATPAPGHHEPAVANWSSPMLGTSDGRPTISGSTEPIAVRFLRV